MKFNQKESTTEVCGVFKASYSPIYTHMMNNNNIIVYSQKTIVYKSQSTLPFCRNCVYNTPTDDYKSQFFILCAVLLLHMYIIQKWKNTFIRSFVFNAAALFISNRIYIYKKTSTRWKIFFFLFHSLRYVFLTLKFLQFLPLFNITFHHHDPDGVSCSLVSLTSFL